MSDLPPVTAEDRQSAWDVFYTTKDYAPVPPRADDYHDQHLLEQLGKVLENDRKRVAESGHYSENRHS